MQRHYSNQSKSLIILKCLYVIISFLCVCSFSESAISFLSPSFDKTPNIQLWLTATQVSIATASLFLVALLVMPIKRRVKIKRLEMFGLVISIVGCVELIYLTDASGSLRKMTSFDLSVSSSVCFMISTLVLMVGTFVASLPTGQKRRNCVSACIEGVKNNPLLFICTTAQLLGNAGFVIQSLSGNKLRFWNEIVFACFIVGVVSAIFLFKKDVKHLYHLLTTRKSEVGHEAFPNVEMVVTKPF
jgi:hypothetical protein